MTMELENDISNQKNYLINLVDSQNTTEDFLYLIANFNGTIIKNIDQIPNSNFDVQIFALGNIELIKSKISFKIVRDFSYNYDHLHSKTNPIIGLGEVPINIHNVGIFYRRMFNQNDFFQNIVAEHKFQNLTESNKSSMALRKGIYLTPINKKENSNELHFRLLRCSSNLTGATDNFRKTDNLIVETINNTLKFDFEQKTELNHVLAQIYENRKNENGKEIKAKIEAHSDKTKDMPKNAVMAFCTFYENQKFDNLNKSKTDNFDWVYKKSSALTRLLFKLKPTVHDSSLVKEFSVTLYPNSVFIIPLSTNRLYTHEIRPSVLNIDTSPTRMGYVVRSSNLEAVFSQNQTFIKEENKLIKLEEMRTETMKDLRNSYYEENKTIKNIDYGKVHFSMNSGDYKKPNY